MPIRRPPVAALLASVAFALAPAAFAKEAPKQSTATYNSFDALTATVWRTDGRRGVLTVQGGLDVHDAALRARAAAFGPVLRDAYVRALNVYAQSLVPGAVPDVDQIGMRLQRATDGVLKRPGAHVLLGTVLVN
jgi:hypothetical protein